MPLAQLGWGPRGERATGEGRAALEWRAEELGLVARGQKLLLCGGRTASLLEFLLLRCSSLTREVLLVQYVEIAASGGRDEFG